MTYQLARSSHPPQTLHPLAATPPHPSSLYLLLLVLGASVFLYMYKKKIVKHIRQKLHHLNIKEFQFQVKVNALVTGK
jgi:hypothetical protein